MALMPPMPLMERLERPAAPLRSPLMALLLQSAASPPLVPVMALLQLEPPLAWEPIMLLREVCEGTSLEPPPVPP
jgi:hypothetical protein